MRIKQVFRSNEVAHVWAQQKQEKGRNAQGNIYFEGKSIFSYGSHFEMARFIGSREVIFTTRSYSNTTSKHLGYTRYSVSHCTVYTLPSFGDHNQNADHYLTGILARVSIINKARSGYNWKLSDLASFQAHALKFLARFKNDVTPGRRNKLRAMARKVFFKPAQLAEFKRKEKKNNLSQAQSRETRRRNDEIRWKNHGRTIDADRAHIDALSTETETVWGDVITDMTRAAWIAGDERARLPYDGPVMLRLVNDQDEIETSQGAFVPTTRAIDLFQAIKAGKDINGFEIGHYTVTGIHDKKLVIGCHRIPLREVYRMAMTLGLEREAA